MSHGMSQVSNEAAQPFSTPPMAVSDVRVPPTVVTDRRPYAENRGVPVSTALKQIAMTPDDMQALRRIALKTRKLGKADIDALLTPNDRHLTILEAFWLLAVTPNEFWEGREDELAPQEHTEAVYIHDHWLKQNAVVRALALIRLEKQMPKDWNLDRSALTPASMAACLRSVHAIC